MANDRTLHIKIDSETDLKLRRLSDIRRKSKGQLVREAISACYRLNPPSCRFARARRLPPTRVGLSALESWPGRWECTSCI